jgi:hypothetical protein
MARATLDDNRAYRESGSYFAILTISDVDVSAHGLTFNIIAMESAVDFISLRTAVWTGVTRDTRPVPDAGGQSGLAPENCWGSIRLGARELDNLGPFFGFIRN